MSDNTPPLTVAVLLEELKEVDNWYMLGAYLNVPVYQLNKIQSTHTQDGVERCKLAMLQYWLDTTMTASWKDIARALKQLNMLTLAARLKLKYLRILPATTADGKKRERFSDSDDGTESAVEVSKTEMSPKGSEKISEQECAALKKVYGEFYHQLVDVLSDGDTHRSIVSDLHKRSVISEKVFAAQMTSTQERGRSLLTVLGLEEKPHKLRELITVMMDVRKAKLLAEEMTAQLSISEQEQHEAAMANPIIKLKNAEEKLQSANKLIEEKEYELKEMRRRVRELEELHFTSSLVQITGEGKVVAVLEQETTIQLNTSSQDTLSHHFLTKQLSCQLANQKFHEDVLCHITHTQPGVCTLTFTPVLLCPHQLKITIRDTEIPGSPFTVHVLDSTDKRMIPENRGIVRDAIRDVKKPHGVAVSNSGEVVVTEHDNHCIGVYSKERKKIRVFGSKGSRKGQFKNPRGVAITSDNYILIADEQNNRIQMFTMEGKFVKSVGQKGEGQLQFNFPSGIAVHPSGRVFVIEMLNHRIQVLNPDLSYSHMFGSQGNAPGQFRCPNGVAINSSGVVHVTDMENHRVQLFSIDGQFISSFGSEGSQHGQLYYPYGICIDSTNTVYITDSNHHVSMYTSSGQFIKCFGTKGSEEGKMNGPQGVAVDNSAGALYVCDDNNNRVVMY